MESRKYQLQKQIIEALKANDNDLYSLLKSQWAHRFGVESLEELKNLNSNDVNQNVTNEVKQKIDPSQDYFSEDDQSISTQDDSNEEKIMIKDNQKMHSDEEKNKESFDIKSSEIFDKANYVNKDLNPTIEYKILPKVKALIPLPPKPKYSYLKKWIVKSKF